MDVHQRSSTTHPNCLSRLRRLLGQASPISYEFSGTLSQPFNGTTQFSGSFTYNTSLPAYPGIVPSPGWSYYSGVPTDPTAPVVSLTFNLGNTASSSVREHRQ